MDRSHKPAAIGVAASLPQPSVTIYENRVDASLPTGESVSVYLYGATVTSWKLASGEEQLFVSEKAILDGSKPIRGGIPIVFPVFGPPPKNHATSSLPQHGFARNSYWEFLGKSFSESVGDGPRKGGDSVKLDFCLSSTMLREESHNAWPFDFGLLYSVTLTKDGLETSLQVHNQGHQAFEFQALLHTYLRIKDISKIRINNLQSATYVDKTDQYAVKTESSPAVAIAQETDRVYLSLEQAVPVVILSEDNKTLLSVTREGLDDITIWNPWVDKAKGMSDFGDNEYRQMVCVEPGSVSKFQTLDAGDAWEGRQTIRPGPNS